MDTNYYENYYFLSMNTLFEILHIRKESMHDGVQ